MTLWYTYVPCTLYRPGAATLSITLLDPRLPVPAGRHPPTRQLSMLPHGGVHKATVYAARAYALWQSLFANTSSTRHENGAQLEKTQLEKLDREMGLRQELAELPTRAGRLRTPGTMGVVVARSRVPPGAQYMSDRPMVVRDVRLHFTS